MGPLRRPPQDEEAEHDTQRRAHMQAAFPKGIDLKMLHAVSGISSTGEPVALLHHLRQPNAVEESSHAQSKDGDQRRRESLSLNSHDLP